MVMPLADSNKLLIKRLFNEYIRPYHSSLMLAFVCMIISALATSLQAWIIKPVLDGIFVEQNKNLLLIIPVGIIILSFILGITDYFHSILMKSMGQKILTRIQIDLYAHLLYADMSFILKESSAKLISRLTYDIQLMRRSVTSVFTGVVKELVTLIALISLMFYHSWFLSILALSIFPVAVYPVIRLGKRMKRVTEATQESVGKFATQLDETFHGSKIVRAYGRERYEINQADSIGSHICKLYIKAARIESLSSPIMEFLGGIAIATVIVYGGTQVVEGVTTTGTFFSFITALIMVYKPIKNISNLHTVLQEGLASTSRVFQLLNKKPQIVEDANAKTLICRQGAVSFAHVDFEYNPGEQILHNITLDIPAGSFIGIVGPSGGGKSTLINLLLRFYDPSSGNITIDNMPIKEVTLDSLRHSIAFVSQEIFLFDDTIEANIRYGRIDATDEDIRHAAREAEAHNFIEEFPRGYQTMIGPHGFTLSGGQRQRVAIARALLKQAPILLLDEATSSLDPLSERLVQAALTRLMKGKTSIVIAHRLSTIFQADCIYALDHGRIMESGTHAELLAKKGLYSQLYSEQQTKNQLL